MCNGKFDILVTLDLKEAEKHYGDIKDDMESLGFFKEVKKDRTNNKINDDEIEFCEKFDEEYDYDLTNTTYAGCFTAYNGYSDIANMYPNIKEDIKNMFKKYDIKKHKVFVFIYEGGYKKEFRKFHFKSKI